MSVDITQVLRIIFEFILITIETIILRIIKIFNRNKLKNIAGQLALITGSAQGLGKELAKKLAKEGCNLALVDINHEKNKNLAIEIREKYPKIKVETFKVDVSRSEEILKLKDDIKEQLGQVNILINNAAFLDFENSILEGAAEDYHKVINVNLMSHFWTIRAFLPDMIKARHGHIIAISSFGIKYPFPFMSIYLCSKAAVKSLMKSLSEELKYSNLSNFIKTTTVYPSFISSESVLNHQRFQILKDSDTPLLKPSRNEPKAIAEEIVTRGILREQSEIYLPRLEVNFLRFLMKFPFGIRRLFWKFVMNAYDEYLNKRVGVYNKMM